MKVLNLKGRLKLIADKVPNCGILYDIGTDHGYLPIYCIQTGKCGNAAACDIRISPLRSAKKNIEAFGLSGQVGVLAGDGLKPLKTDIFAGGHSYVIVLSGLGGETIVRILSEETEKASGASAIVIQPMNSPEFVREWLYKNHFEITDEELAEDDKRIYLVITARYTGNTTCNTSPDMPYIGLKLIEKNDPLLSRYIAKIRRHYSYKIMKENSGKIVQDSADGKNRK